MATLWTNTARCKDCNRCVRVCPVKAVRKESSQAQVIPERCVLCGMCARECPQHAKSYARELDKVLELLASPGVQVVASVAPSYSGAIPASLRRRLPSVLRQLGFKMVTETAVGAEIVALRTKELVEQNPSGKYITTACPAVTSYVRRYRPLATAALVPIVSPMIAHANHLKSTLGAGTEVVFIGPCIAKKDEARLQSDGAVAAVLTFEELAEWMDSRGISLNAAEDSEFDGDRPSRARLFPVSGGFAHAADLSTDHLSRNVISVSGARAVIEAVDYLLESTEPVILDALMCENGCLGGAGMAKSQFGLSRRYTFLQCVAEANSEPDTREPFSPGATQASTGHEYDPEPLEPPAVDEAEIRKALAATGKFRPEDELNCGACGYDTCRDKAIHVVQGIAELEMCIPFMRQSAETKTDSIVENSPNAIVILDENLRIVRANQQFYQMFVTSESCRGKRIDYFMDAQPFQQVAARSTDLYDELVQHSAYGLTCQQLIYRVMTGQSEQIVGILVNLTRTKRQEAEYNRLREEALSRAEEVIEKQVQIAQDIAKLLGKSAAETRTTLRRLTDLVKHEEVS